MEYLKEQRLDEVMNVVADKGYHREERVRSEDMGGYYRVAADDRELNYDKFVVNAEVKTMATRHTQAIIQQGSMWKEQSRRFL